MVISHPAIFVEFRRRCFLGKQGFQSSVIGSSLVIILLLGYLFSRGAVSKRIAGIDHDIESKYKSHVTVSGIRTKYHK